MYSKFPAMNYNSAFAVFQGVFVASLVVLGLPWARLVLGDRAGLKRLELESEVAAAPHYALAKSAANGTDLIKLIQGTAIDRLCAVTAVSSYAAKKSEKMQEAFNRGIVPIALVVFLILLSSYAAAELLPSPAIDPAIHMTVSLLQAYGGAVTFVWTMGVFWGEVELLRDVVRSVL
jgi:hypothetical protein